MVGRSLLYSPGGCDLPLVFELIHCAKPDATLPVGECRHTNSVTGAIHNRIAAIIEP